MILRGGIVRDAEASNRCTGSGGTGGLIGGGQTMPGDAQQAVPQPTGYTPA